MASIITRKNGRREIRFLNPDGSGKTCTLRLGKVVATRARGIERFIEDLVTAKIQRSSPNRETSEWVDGVEPTMHNRLVQFGLVKPRMSEALAAASPTLAEYKQVFLDSKLHIKDSTRAAIKVGLDRVAEGIGPDVRLSAVTEEMALAAIKKLQVDSYSPAFISKVIKINKQMFRLAVRRGVITVNPLAEIKSGSQVNNSRKQMIPADVVYKVLDAVPDIELRLAVAMARWGGLRIPSEIFAMKWEHILWDKDRMIVPTPKLEHYEGKETRIVPIFPEIKPYLDEAWDAAEDGAVYLTPRLRNLSGNLSTMLDK